MTDAAPQATRPGDEIRLRLPGDPTYGRLARIAATSLARRLGCTFHQIEDLGLAVDEAVILLHQPAGTPVEGIDVRLTVHAGAIAVEATALPRSGEGAAPLLDEAVARFEELVAGTVADWSVDPAARTVALTARP